MSRAVLLALAVAGCASVPAGAQTVLTLEAAIARARERAAAVVVARARIAEAEASLVDSSLRFRANPLVEVGAGPRSGGGTRTTDLDIGVSQLFETGGQRRARLAVAHAAVERQRAEAERVSRGAVFDSASAFLQGVAALERLRIAEEADALSRDLLAAIERRYAVGDIAAIDLNLARIDRARSAATLQSARAVMAETIGSLRVLLQLPATERIELAGSLDVHAAPALDTLEASILQRPELAALAAEVREAEAQAELGRAAGRPDVGLRVGYQREESDTVVVAGFAVTLPAFDRGQGTVAAGRARAARARLELDTARDAAFAEVRTAREVFDVRLSLGEALVRDATPSLADNESLSRRSYEAGEMSLMNYLMIRRDALDTRTAIVERRLDAALGRLTVDFLAGVLR